MSEPTENPAGDGVSPDSVDAGLAASNPDLLDSEIASSTDVGSASEDEGWFGSIGTDFRSIATCFKNTIPPVIGGVASVVHKTAMSVAAEIAELEREGELESQRWRDDEEPDSLPLPWEIRQDYENNDIIPVYITDEELMDEILALSLSENTFLKPDDDDNSSDENFVLDEARITLIRRLLDIDENLAAIHSRLSGRRNVKENSFWKNYFLRCKKVRADFFERRKGAKTLLEKDDFSNQNISPSSNIDDSLIAASSTDGDSSFVEVVPPAPNSMDTFMSLESLDDGMVLVGTQRGKK